MDLALDCLEFKDCNGLIRTVYGCSLKGVDEFRSRIDVLIELIKAAEAESTVLSLYQHNEQFRHHCDRCLALNGVEPDWLDSKGELLTSLLVIHEGQPGMLIRLNQPEQSTKAADPNAKSATVADLAAVILGLTNDLGKAIEAIERYPAKEVVRIIEARSEQLADSDPAEREKRKRQEWAAERRKQTRQPIKLESPIL